MKRMVWEPLTGDDVGYDSTEPIIGIWVYGEGEEISASTKDVEIFVPLPPHIRLCRLTETDVPSAPVEDSQQILKNDELDTRDY